MRQMFDMSNSLSTEFSGLAFYGEQQQHPTYGTDRYTYTNSGNQGGMFSSDMPSSRSYAQMNNISAMHHAQAYQVLDDLQNEKQRANSQLNTFETQIKMEFDDTYQSSSPPHHHHGNDHHSNQYHNSGNSSGYESGGGNISQSLPDIRIYSDGGNSPHHLTVPHHSPHHHHQYQRAKSLSHPPSPNMLMDSSSSDGGDDSPKLMKRSSSMTTPSSSSSSGSGKSASGAKESSRPRMYKFNPKPLTLNPSMKRAQTAADNKDDDYWEKRKKNNEASRRSRLARRLKECMVMEEMKKLKKENEELKAELSKMQNSSICRM